MAHIVSLQDAISLGACRTDSNNIWTRTLGLHPNQRMTVEEFIARIHEKIRALKDHTGYGEFYMLAWYTPWLSIPDRLTILQMLGESPDSARMLLAFREHHPDMISIEERCELLKQCDAVSSQQMEIFLREFWGRLTREQEWELRKIPTYSI